VDNCFSGYQYVASGVPQGGVLSGLLFALYINDLPAHMKSSHISLYADDAKIYSEISNQASIENMQQDLDAMVVWCTEWRLSLNASKCYQIQYNPQSAARTFNPTYMLHDTPVTRKHQVKDLGILISESLKYHDQVAEVCKRAHREINRIRRSFVSRAPKFISELYKTYVRPHLEYCVEVWNPMFEEDIRKMEKVQNKMTKLIRNGNQLTPDQRNQHLGLTSHQTRRMRGDLINIYKNIDNHSYFTLRNNVCLRGHSKTIVIPRSSGLIKAHSFSVRSLKEWNALPDEIVNSNSLNSFKSSLDRYFMNQ